MELKKYPGYQAVSSAVAADQMRSKNYDKVINEVRNQQLNFKEANYFRLINFFLY